MIHYFNINTKQITENGMDISCIFDVSEMDLNFRNFTAVKQVNARLNVTLVSNEIIVMGSLEGCYKSECDRCLAEVELPFDIRNVIITREYHGEDFIDISPEIRDEILLSLPTKILCSEGCRGICPGCKVNLNEKACECGKPDKQSPFHNLKV